MAKSPLLEPNFLRKLEYLSLVSRRVHRGSTRGEHSVYRRGSSLEFSDYRNYQAGDDIRYLDWNLYSRLDRLFIKQFITEEDLTIHLLIDASASMSSGEKIEYARKVAAALGYIGIINLDRVAASTFAAGLKGSLPPQRSRQQIFSLFRFLEGVIPAGETGFNQSLLAYSKLYKRPGLAIIISDLLDAQGFEQGLKELLYRKFDIVLIQILSEEEIEPQFAGHARLIDLETGAQRSLLIDKQLLSLYRDRTFKFFKRIEEFSMERGIEYLRTSTVVPFEDLILKYLSQGLHLR